MKKLLSAIICLITIFSINLSVHAAENAQACATGCGGTVKRGYTTDVEYSAFSEDCEVSGCKIEYIFIYDIEFIECNNCNYYDEINRSLMDVLEVHSGQH